MGALYQTAFYGLAGDVAVVGVWRDGNGIDGVAVCQALTPTPTFFTTVVSAPLIENPCATEASVVIREFEADMLMNFFLNLYDPNDYAQNQRRLWTANQLNPNDLDRGWVQNAQEFTQE